MKSIVGFAIYHWRLTIGLMLFFVIGGLIAMPRMAVDAEPDVPFPYINVQVLLPGVSPEDSQRLLVRPMETELKSIDGIKEMTGIAATSVGYMVLEFNASFDQDEAIGDVQEKIDRVRSKFPQEAKEPLIEEINISTFPILVVNLYGNAPERELQHHAKIIQRHLESIPEVLAANISGERIDVLEAVIDPALIESAGVSFNELAGTISQNNALVAAGALETSTGKYNVKVPGLIENPDDLAELVIRADSEGGIIRMKDVANVRRSYKDVTTYARFDGQKSVSVEVSKRTGENIIKTIEKVEQVVNDVVAKDDWPASINVAYSQDKSEYIYSMVTSLFSSIINAVVLVFIVCIAALGLRSALFVGWAIPASFLMALFMFFIEGQTINMMIMFGLILSVGVLVDSAIVIIEYADRKLAEGLPRREAFQTAGERMFWPIISSTATTLVAFLPLLFWDTVTGRFMAYMPLTMIYVLIASSVMALIFLPTMGALIGPKGGKKNADNANLQALSGTEGDPSKLTGPMGVYVRTIQKLIERPTRVLLAAILLLIAILWGFSAAMGGDNPKPVEFFTQTPSDQIYILARARGNTTPLNDLDIALEIERRLRDVDNIEAVYTVAGASAAGSGAGGESQSGPTNVPTDTVARIYTELVPFEQRNKNIMLIIDEMREATANIPGVLTEVTAQDSGPPIGKDVNIRLSGDNVDELRSLVKYVRAHASSVPALFEIEDTLPLPGIEWELEVDREQAGRLGLDVSQIGAAIQFVTEGALVGYYRPLDTDDEVDIRIRHPQGQRDVKELDNLRILTPKGAVPLSAVVTRKARPRQDQITRKDQHIAYEIRANVREGYAPNRAVQELKNWLSDEADLPEGVSYKFLGQEEENAATAQFGKTAAIAILFMMSLILLLQFNSFYHVLLTLLAIIMSIFGVILGLTFYPFVSMLLTMTGMIALAGIVVNNNIVLIDTYQRLSQNGFAPREAALRTAAQRMRPVLLTTITTVIGLMPLIMSWQADIFTGTFSTRGTSTSDIWAPISYVIACGLSFATLLTLIVTPVLLAAPAVWKDMLIALRDRYTDKSGDKSGDRSAKNSQSEAPAK